LGILKKIKIGELGEVNETLIDLNNKTNKFLREYDEDNNGTVDVSELKEKREKFAEDLSKEDKDAGGGSQLGDIVQAILELEEVIIKYRQGSIDEEERKKIDLEIENLLEKLTEKQATFSNEFEQRIRDNLPNREVKKFIHFTFLGEKNKNQVLVISQVKNWLKI